LKEWGLIDYISIERKLAEYGNPSITHNVEFTIHPVIKNNVLDQEFTNKLSSKDIAKALGISSDLKNNMLIDNKSTIKNACLIAENKSFLIVSNIVKIVKNKITTSAAWQMTKY